MFISPRKIWVCFWQVPWYMPDSCLCLFPDLGFPGRSNNVSSNGKPVWGQACWYELSGEGFFADPVSWARQMTHHHFLWLLAGCFPSHLALKIQPGGASPPDSNTPLWGNSRHFLVPGKLHPLNSLVFQDKEMSPEKWQLTTLIVIPGSLVWPQDFAYLLKCSAMNWKNTCYVLCSIYRNYCVDFQTR